LILWEAGVAAPKLYPVEVTVDAAALERYLEQVLPGEDVTVTSSGNSITLSGTVKDPNSVARALQIAQATGVTSVIDNLVAPPAVQVLLQVRFAEINRSALKDFATTLRTLNPQDLDSDGDWFGESISDGLLRIMLTNPAANIEALFTSSASRGLLRNLAEPNLLTLPGKEANFLAGGEFPYPSVQGGAANNAVSIVFKEFGIRLKFTPNITRSGAIRLQVEPEVSSLDFANGLVISGFAIPTILTRRMKTEVELAEGQWLALAGLIDNTTLENVTKIPILGDIPILGQFFRSTSAQARQTELLVLVTPRLIRATDGPPPPVPTGEPITWKWPGWMRRALEQQRPTTPPQG
ncbi:MAG TPA: BON domain-containing protein, partial [Gemmatimonadales bacterium]